MKTFKNVTGIIAMILFAGSAFAQIQVDLSYENSEIMHNGYGTTEILSSYTLENNSSHNIALERLDICLNGNNIQNLQVWIGANYEYIQVFEIENPQNNQICEFDPYILGIGNDMVISIEADLMGNGEFDLELNYMHYGEDLDQDGIPDDALTERYCGIISNHMLVNLNQDMTELGTWEEDEIFVFPGQRINLSQGIDMVYDNSFGHDIVQFNYFTNIWGFWNGVFSTNYWTEQELNDLGNLVINPEDYYYQMYWMSNNDEGIGYTGLSNTNVYNDIPVGESGGFDTNVSISLYNPLYGYEDELHYKSITVHSNTGIIGDVSGNNYVDSEDLDMLIDHFMTGSNWNTRYAPEGEINIFRSSLIFDWPTQFDSWLLNIWLNNPDNELVSNLCIGEEFTLAECVPTEEYSSTQNGEELVITTEGNVVSIHGSLNGEPWTATQFLESNQLNSWNEKMGPEIYLVNHINGETNEFTFILPEGIENVEIGTALLSGQLDIENNEEIISESSLKGNYPNPFNPSTTISFYMKESGFTNLSVYNIKGQLVKTLISGNLEAVSHQINFDGSKLSSGTYFYTLQTSTNTITKKMILMK